MGKKIPITNKTNYNTENPKKNRFVWFRVDGEIYNRFRNKNELPYFGELSYNFIKNELGIVPDTKEDERWTEKEDFYKLISTGIYECGDDGFIYVWGNGDSDLSPTEDDARELSRRTGLEFRVKE